MVRASRKRVILGPDPSEAASRKPVDLEQVEARREFLTDMEAVDSEVAPSSSFTDVLGSDYPIPDWLITEDYTEHRHGSIKSGKEASVWLLERVSGDRSNLLARKTYIDRNFKGDSIYGEGRKIRSSRDRKAIERGTAHGKKLSRGRWWGTEWDVLRKLWLEGIRVPYPVSEGAGVTMQFIGDHRRAAPRIIDVRGIDQELAAEMCEQILVQVRRMAANYIVHGDLSPYNVLWWEEHAWIIDFPQAADIVRNPHGVDLLRRDIANVCKHFTKFGVERDLEEEFAAALGEVYA